MPNTYVALATQTLATAASSVTFSSIPSGYTDLVIVCSARSSWTTDQYDGLGFVFNGDTGNNYSTTFVAGNGSSASSFRETNQPQISTRIDPSFSSNTAFSPIIVQIQNYSNATTNKTVLIRSNANVEFYKVTASVGLWRNTAAITSIFIGNARGNLVAGSTFSLYGISNVGEASPKATGGIVTSDATYWYHAFPMSGNFVPNQSLTADVLVVAGGGGGAFRGNRGGGGGGAGGLLAFTSQALTAISYSVIIGGGGAGGSSNYNGVNGSNSRFGSLTASVGGGGGDGDFAGGLSGGSGGGASVTATGGANTSGQGFAGGNGGSGGIVDYYGAGGGGGATAAGAVGLTSTSIGSAGGGAGGAGSSAYSTWATATSTGVSGAYAGGGGGGSGNYSGSNGAAGGAGGSGGGGAGTGVLGTNGTPGTVNTGGGGGGANSGAGGAGGAGIVIVRYAK